jgi:type VI secretion system protein ImpK
MNPDDAIETRESSRGQTTGRGEPLALLYQGILTTIVRVQSRKRPELLADPAALQRRMESVLDEIEREAIRAGYRNQDVLYGHYAIVGFLDEAIQKSEHPNRNKWESLQAKRFERAVAGEGIYQRLKEIRARRDSPDLADLLEVYYLGLLLGYEGKYGIDGRAELDRLMEELRDQINRIRGIRPALSPEGALPIATVQVDRAPAPDKRWGIAALACAAFALISWVVLYLTIGSYAESMHDTLGSEQTAARHGA